MVLSKTIYTKNNRPWRKRIYEVVKHLPAEELDERIKKLEKDTRVLKKP